MPVRIELYGIPRHRAGIDIVEIDAADLGTALDRLAALAPPFADACLDGRRLRTGFVANLNGRSFTTDPRTPLADGDALLILSADAGG